MRSVSFSPNGTQHEIEVRPEQTLLDVPRGTFKMKSVKGVCAPQSVCCCLTRIDSAPKNACMVKADKVAGRTITSLEGSSDNERRHYADVFQAGTGLQCGFCTSGIVLQDGRLTKGDFDAMTAEARLSQRG